MLRFGGIDTYPDDEVRDGRVQWTLPDPFDYVHRARGGWTIAKQDEVPVQGQSIVHAVGPTRHVLSSTHPPEAIPAE